MTRPGWDDYFLGIAKAVAARADCTRRQVGAVIVDENRRVVATGYNGTLAGDPGCLTDAACPRGKQSYEELPVSNSGYEPGTPGYCIAVHAEENAVLFNSVYTNAGCTLYCTHEPCDKCTRLAWASGIETIVTPEEVIHRNMRYPRTVVTDQKVSVH